MSPNTAQCPDCQEAMQLIKRAAEALCKDVRPGFIQAEQLRRDIQEFIAAKEGRS